MMQSETTKVWLITGSTSGFGKRLVLSTLARGDRVIATGRNTDKLGQLVSSVRPELADNIRTVQLDVTEDEEEIKVKMDQAAGFWGCIDVLVNNAGIGLLGILEEAGTKYLRRQFETNFFGLMSVTNATLPYLRKAKDGCVVVFGSRSAWRPEVPGLGNYAASKAAVHAITETLMAELSHLHIRVLLVEPGAFRTEGIYGQPYFDLNPIEDYDSVRRSAMTRFASIPGREPGDPDKAVEAIVDVVRGEGVAKGRPWPDYLFLGDDAEAAVRAKCSKLLKVLDVWADVTRNVRFPFPSKSSYDESIVEN